MPSGIVTRKTVDVPLTLVAPGPLALVGPEAAGVLPDEGANAPLVVVEAGPLLVLLPSSFPFPPKTLRKLNGGIIDIALFVVLSLCSLLFLV